LSWNADSTRKYKLNNEEVIGVIRIRHRIDNDSSEKAGHIGYEIKRSKRKKAMVKGCLNYLMIIFIIEIIYLMILD